MKANVLIVDDSSLARRLLRRMLEELAQEPYPIKELLEIVEHQKHLSVSQKAEQLLLGFNLPAQLEADGSRDHRGENIGRVDTRQRNQTYAVEIHIYLILRGPQRDPALADAAWPDQREQPAMGIGQ